jgi:hypothetical protein
MLHHILFLSFLITLQIAAWSNGPVDRAESIVSQAESSQEKEKADGEYSEFYYMKGIQVSQNLCYISHFCEPGEVVEADTLKTSFIVKLTFSSERPDSVLFDGLEGFNIAPREMFSGFIGGGAAYPECISPSLNCGYVKITDNELTFNQSSPSGYYTGTGKLENDRLTIHAHYTRRGHGVEYILEGQKIVGLQ